jgi:hypothetical protein
MSDEAEPTLAQKISAAVQEVIDADRAGDRGENDAPETLQADVPAEPAVTEPVDSAGTAEGE